MDTNPQNKSRTFRTNPGDVVKAVLACFDPVVAGFEIANGLFCFFRGSAGPDARQLELDTVPAS